MTRNEFHAKFDTAGPVVLPVIHARSLMQAEENVRVLLGEGAPGCFLINHDFSAQRFLPIVRDIRAMFEDLWIGLNILDHSAHGAFALLGQLEADGCRVDGYWADNAEIDEAGGD